MKIEVLVDCKTTLGEGPLWDVDEQRLYWFDIYGNRVFRCTAAGSEVQADKPANRFNDGKVDRSGRFFAGTIEPTETSASAALYRLDPDLRVTTVERGMFCSNGPCWSPDGRTFYFADTPTNRISAYDYDPETGEVSNKRTFAELDFPGGLPDGATVDEEDCLWTAVVYAGKIARYSPDGRLDRVIEMPVKKVTSVMFGGPELDVLYVTSMAKPPLPKHPGDGVLRGALFAITGLGVRGIPEPRFAG